MPTLIADGSAINVENVTYAKLRAIIWDGDRTGLPTGVTRSAQNAVTQWVEFAPPSASGTTTVNPAQVSQLVP